MRILSLFSASMILLATATSCLEYDRVLRVGDGKVIRFEQMLEDMKSVTIIFVGESHDNKKHHQSQLDVIKALNESGVSLAVGLEMFRTDSQRELDQWVKGSLGLDEFLKVYYADWGLPWPLYRDIFLYSRNNKIPLVGLNVPHEITQKVSRQGFSSLNDKDLKQLPPGISCDIDAEYMDFIRRAYKTHHIRGKSFVNFCEAQMVWDKTMAWNLLNFLEENPNRTVVVLAGIGHSWRRGIPEQIGKWSKLRYKVILPEVPDQIDKNTVTPQDADYILLG